ncbi:hypothetical protein [Methylobacterium oxalidis]|uniref:Uncharacterized protein n=1 Tax=Methylobacterium oxalidis TaxID=944322 RepID=A0A512JDA5_9HYPH|nr:hypothetical protein [Methylobacterium oxalidis]GEP07921.1 hypothetical protein MOX02_59590 [Methylobacterium oxalidis]GJE33597.1 hypothetical protein LDDCCGHA_3798 [Methylobacterium oxalidis]GLS66137.1 hypothetical protein GCM10007888_45190 [Methylobacterium oxalidis]
MTQREQAEQVHDLFRLADRLRVPGHRNNVETFLGDLGELRVGLRRLYRDMTGAEPARERTSKRPSIAAFPAGPIAGTRAVVQHRGRPRRLAASA